MKTKSLAIVIVLILTTSLIALSQYTDNKEFKKNNDIKYPNHGSIVIASADTLGSLITQRNDSSINSNDSLPNTPKNRRTKSPLTSSIDYSADDSTIYSIDGRKVYLFGNAKINYEDIELTAAYIEVDMEKNILYAEGVPDSLGKVQGQPIFTQGGETMQAKKLTYNVQTQKGFIRGLYSEQEEGYLHSEETKKEPDNTINLNRGKYTTCELEHPHFYLKLSKAKVVPDKAIVASYSYLVIADVPLYPIMLPFGYFPTKKERASGFIIPTFGEEQTRGFFLKEGGYYFAFNDYVDLTLKGDIYSKGSWQIGAASKYKLRYKFSGNVNLAYSKVITGEPELEDYSESNQYSIRWTHSQDAKARPNSNFNANVNFASTEQNKYNSVSSNDYLTNTISSSISYRKTFANTPFSMSMNLKHSQNNQTKLYDFTLPQMTFNMNKIFPFRKKVAVGKTRWYENIGLTYSSNLENRYSGVPDTILFQSEMQDYMKNGMKHVIPISTSIKLLKYFNLSPSFNFTDRTYINRTIKVQKNDTVIDKDETGFYNIYDYTTGISLGTKLYGMYQFRSKYIKAIRHVATPSVSINYKPDFRFENNGGYMYNRYDSTYYSPYSDNLYFSSSSGKTGAVSFSLSNNVEMKVANKKDTVNQETKIKLLESLNFRTSYNMMAQEFKWSPLSMSARTTLFKTLSINMSASGDFYALDSAGNRMDAYQYKIHPGKPFRLTRATASTSLSFNSEKLFGKGETSDKIESEGMVETYDENPLNPYSLHNVYNYDYFDVPWNLSFSYSLTYSKPELESDIKQTLSFNGDVKLTNKWKINFRSGWDFEAKEFTYTSFNLSRDLHCWVATLSLIPFGQRQSYNFTIGVKASVLKDLKYKKNKSWLDNNY